MQLSIGAIHDLYSSLSTLQPDQSTGAKEVATKLSGEVRLNIAITLNRIRDVAVAYEVARGNMVAEIWQRHRQVATEAKWRDDLPLPGEHQAAIQAEVAQADRQLRQGVEEVSVRTFVQTDLRLEENPQISGKLLEGLIPIIVGLAETEKAA